MIDIVGLVRMNRHEIGRIEYIQEYHYDAGYGGRHMGADFLAMVDTDQQLPDPDVLPLQPVGLVGIELYPFQKKTYYYAQRLEQSCVRPIEFHVPSIQDPGRMIRYTYKSSVGIIGETTGAGKSIIMLAIIAGNPRVYDHYVEDVDHLDCRHMQLRTHQEYEMRSMINVIVIPHDLMKQWVNYISMHLDRTYHRYYIKTDKDLAAVIPMLEAVQMEPTVVLVTNLRYQTFMLEMQRVRINISRLIFDEADSIDLKRSSMIRNSSVGFTWFISANIHNFTSRNQGQLAEIYMDMIRIRGIYRTRMQDDNPIRREFARSLFQHTVLRNPPAIVEATFRLPAPSMVTIYSKEERTLRVLQDVIAPDVREMIAAGNFQAAAEAIGLKTEESSDSIISHLTSDIQKKIRNLQVDYYAAEHKEYATEARKGEVLNGIRVEIRRFKEQIEGIRQRLESDNIDPITMDEIVQPVVLPCCHNKMDMATISQWLDRHSSCPMCRQHTRLQDLIFIGPAPAAAAAAPLVEQAAAAGAPVGYDSKEHTKEENLLWMLREHIRIGPETRILLYMKNGHISSETFRQIELMGLPIYETRNSNFAHRIDDFRQGKIRVLVLNSNAMGTGFNMEFVTDLILYHHLIQHSLEQQVIGRAQRPGRSNVLNIWRMLHMNEV